MTVTNLILLLDETQTHNINFDIARWLLKQKLKNYKRVTEWGGDEANEVISDISLHLNYFENKSKTHNIIKNNIFFIN